MSNKTAVAAVPDDDGREARMAAQVDEHFETVDSSQEAECVGAYYNTLLKQGIPHKEALEWAYQYQLSRAEERVARIMGEIEDKDS